MHKRWLRGRRLGLLAGLLAGSLAGCENSPAQQGPAASGPVPGPAAPGVAAPRAAAMEVLRPQPATLGYLTLKALHMDCAETCPMSARIALQRVASVYQVGVDLEHDTLFISYDRSVGAPQQAAVPMLAALRAIGFDPWFKAEGWPTDVQTADLKVLPLE